MKIKWSPLSVERLTDIVNHISEDKPNAARMFADTIFNTIERLIEFPESGRVVPELDNPKYRELLVGNYRIIYSIMDDTVQLLTIRHQKQLLKIKDIK